MATLTRHNPRRCRQFIHRHIAVNFNGYRPRLNRTNLNLHRRLNLQLKRHRFLTQLMTHLPPHAASQLNPRPSQRRLNHRYILRGLIKHRQRAVTEIDVSVENIHRAPFPVVDPDLSVTVTRPDGDVESGRDRRR